MRAIFFVGSLSLILTNGTAGAQSGPPPKSATSSTTAQIPRTPNDPTKADRLSPSDKERIAQYMSQCLNDWDAATHMTKPEWARVCRRVDRQPRQIHARNRLPVTRSPLTSDKVFIFPDKVADPDLAAHSV